MHRTRCLLDCSSVGVHVSCGTGGSPHGFELSALAQFHQPPPTPDTVAEHPNPFLLQGHSFVFPQPNESSLPSHSTTTEQVVPGSSTFAGFVFILPVPWSHVHFCLIHIGLVIIFIYMGHGGQISPTMEDKL